jgi:hypothetical protein
MTEGGGCWLGLFIQYCNIYNVSMQAIALWCQGSELGLPFCDTREEDPTSRDPSVASLPQDDSLKLKFVILSP